MINSGTEANCKGVVTILLWSFAALFISWTPEIPPFLLASCTSAIGLSMFGLRWMKNKEQLLVAIRQPASVWILFSLAVIAYRGCYISGLKTAPPVEANLLNYLWPLLIVIFGALYDRKVPQPRVLYGTVYGFVGVVVLLLPNWGIGFGEKLELGHCLAFLGAVCWGGYSVFTRRVKITSNDLLGVMHGAACIVFLASHLLFEKPVSWASVDLYHLIAIIELGLAISLGYSWWDDAMSKGNQEQLAIGANFIPLLSTVWLVLLGCQVVTLQLLVAAGLIVTGSLIAKTSEP